MGKCFEAMEVDSLSSSHPVSSPVENPTQIQEMFDDVSYDKVRLPIHLPSGQTVHVGLLHICATVFPGRLYPEHAKKLPDG